MNCCFSFGENNNLCKIDNILIQFNYLEGDAAADVVEAEFVRRQHLDNVKNLD